MLTLSKALLYYKREDIRKAMAKHAENKEVTARYNDKFGKRPDILTNENDILELAKQGATSFHCSEELWRSPLQLTLNMKPSELNELRTGWDLILDIDCHFFEYSKIAAYYTVKLLKHLNVNSVTAKFSGNKGFHIAVPFEAFPTMIGKTYVKDLFPEAPRRIAEYIKYMISAPVADAILKIEKGSFSAVIKKTGKTAAEITKYSKDALGSSVPKLNVKPFLDIDTVLISPRHLYRMPYSFHEKSGLVSVPVNVDKIILFKKEDALPSNVKIKNDFLARNAVKNEALKLFISAFDHNAKEIEEKKAPLKEIKFSELTEAIPEELFPPCIKKILLGMNDGRKRGLFILINFLTSVGWDYDKIEARLKEWNSKNSEPLRDAYLFGQLRYHKTQKKKILPPNCDNNAYYKDLGLYCGDEFHKNIKNPVQYSKKRVWMIKRDKNRNI